MPDVILHRLAHRLLSGPTPDQDSLVGKLTHRALIDTENCREKFPWNEFWHLHFAIPQLIGERRHLPMMVSYFVDRALVTCQLNLWQEPSGILVFSSPGASSYIIYKFDHVASVGPKHIRHIMVNVYLAV
jgi:hypothetical protein